MFNIILGIGILFNFNPVSLPVVDKIEQFQTNIEITYKIDKNNIILEWLHNEYQIQQIVRRSA